VYLASYLDLKHHIMTVRGRNWSKELNWTASLWSEEEPGLGAWLQWQRPEFQSQNSKENKNFKKVSVSKVKRDKKEIQKSMLVIQSIFFLVLQIFFLAVLQDVVSWDTGHWGNLAGSNIFLCQHRLSGLMSKGWALRTKGSHLMYTCKQITEAKCRV
jgi:hypothetical protein